MQEDRRKELKNRLVLAIAQSESESVQVRGWRAILADQMAVAKFSNLEQRMLEIGEMLDERNRDTHDAGQGTHPDRPAQPQRPPEGDWWVWGYVAGRGAGEYPGGACWSQPRAQDGTMKLGCLIAPTKAGIRDVMVEGPSGLVDVAPPWCRPRFKPSKHRVAWLPKPQAGASESPGSVENSRFLHNYPPWR